MPRISKGMAWAFVVACAGLLVWEIYDILRYGVRLVGLITAAVMVMAIAEVWRRYLRKGGRPE